MEQLHRAVSTILCEKKAPPPSKLAQDCEMTKLALYFNSFCNLVYWENATHIWLSFVCLNLLYLLIIYYETRFYCIVFSTAAVLVVLDYYDDAIKFQDLECYIQEWSIAAWRSKFIRTMLSWKRDSPLVFCCSMTTFFLILSWIGRTISGRVLSYVFILAVYFGPALLRLAPRKVTKGLWDLVKTVRSNEIIGEHELIPMIGEYVENDSMDETRTQDSFNSSLVCVTAAMPSHLDESDQPDSTCHSTMNLAETVYTLSHRATRLSAEWAKATRRVGRDDERSLKHSPPEFSCQPAPKSRANT